MRPLFFYGWMVEICSINKIFVDLVGCLVDSTPGGPSPSREERDREIGREREREREPAGDWSSTRKGNRQHVETLTKTNRNIGIPL